MRKTSVKLLAGLALVITVTATGTVGTAVADPAVTPSATDIVGVGTEDTEGVLNELSAGYNAYLAGLGDTASPRLRSWDANGSALITVRAGTAPISRPHGTRPGILKLMEPRSPADFARSSRGPELLDPGTQDPQSNVFVAFAKDAVTWSAKAGGHAPGSLSTAQLKSIYECYVTNWQQIDPALPNAAIKPYLPRYTSDTRSFFLKALGNPALGGCVTTGPQENEGTDPALDDPDVVFPYSVAHYIGQVYGGHSSGTDAPGSLAVRSIDGISPFTAANTLSPQFASMVFGRTVYNVVRESEWMAADAHGAALRNIFGMAGRNGWICKNGTDVIKSYGFLPLPGTACGSTIQNP
ncbi:substrate-binding domain-containing protein [Kitasatospora sp. NPDC088351]|uniref:substrate-binding domain-containing protein n=1 Tax=Kitasatospora sp. NPDC088351 TaxID=3155180 RepID=UPI0034121A3D